MPSPPVSGAAWHGCRRHQCVRLGVALSRFWAVPLHRQSSVQGSRTALEQGTVKLFDLGLPGEAMAMNDLGEEDLSGRTQVEDLLALQLEPPALACDRRQPRGSIFRMKAVLALFG